MSIVRLTASLWIALSATALISAAELPVQPLKFELTGGVMDGPDLAYAMMRTFMPEAEWKQRVDECRRRFETWEHDNRGDMGQFLNDRLIMVALSAAGGEVEEIKKGVAYLALYHEFQQQPHGAVLKFLREHKETVTELISSFTWEKASEYVTSKRWREDIARRRTRGRQQLAEAQPADTSAARTVAAAEPKRTEFETAAVPSRLEPAAENQALSEATLQLMSLNWQTLSEPLTAETPMRAK